MNTVNAYQKTEKPIDRFKSALISMRILRAKPHGEVPALADSSRNGARISTKEPVASPKPMPRVEILEGIVRYGDELKLFEQTAKQKPDVDIARLSKEMNYQFQLMAKLGEFIPRISQPKEATLYYSRLAEGLRSALRMEAASFGMYGKPVEVVCLFPKGNVIINDDIFPIILRNLANLVYAKSYDEGTKVIISTMPKGAEKPTELQISFNYYGDIITNERFPDEISYPKKESRPNPYPLLQIAAKEYLGGKLEHIQGGKDDYAKVAVFLTFPIKTV